MADRIHWPSLAEPVARTLLGEPNAGMSKPGRELRFGNDGALAVDLRQGVFMHHGREGGGILDLIRHELGGNRSDAWAWLVDMGLVEGTAGGEPGVAQAQTPSEPKRPSAEAQAAAERARWAWDHAAPVGQAGHPYLARKGVTGDDLRIDRRGNLLVPMRAAVDGPVVNVQRIDADGRKRFTKGARKAGTFFRIEGAGAPIFAEGYATAATVHAATGRAVVVTFDAGNLVEVAAALADEGSAVAADNDLAVKPGTSFRRRHDTWGAGHRKADQTGLPYYLPHRPGSDFNDLGADETAAAFAAAPISDVPIFDAWKLERVEIKGRRDGDHARALGRSHDPAEAAAAAWTVAARMAPRAPAQVSIAGIREFLWRHIPYGAVNPATLDNIAHRLDRAQQYRRQAALAPVSIPDDALARHQHERLAVFPESGLPAEWLEGVVVVQAPKGSGKTQRVGATFAAHARQRGKVLAICHRISLVGELARRLDLHHYQDLPEALAWASDGMATCLPSITRPDHGALIDRAEFVFVDEVSQVLRFLEAERQCSTQWANNAQVYEKLREIVRRARCVVVADAGADGRTIEFLESCRPGERFRIVTLPERRPDAPSADVFTGGNATGSVVGAVLAELAAGGKAWLACEGKGKAQAIADLAGQHGFRALAVTADNKGNAAQRALLEDADAVSREYDLVVASPVISSGLSIEHRGAPHFTMGAFLGGGQRVTPADAAQQLARVRYLERFAIGLLPNNEIGQQDPDAILRSWETAARVEGAAGIAGDFDRLVASIRADETNARADFAAGLLWQLDRAGWQLRHSDGEDAVAQAETRLAQTARDHARRRGLIAARAIDRDEAAAIERRTDRTEAENVLLEAHRIRQALGVETLDDDTLDFWDDGRAVKRMDRFAAAHGIVPTFDDSSHSLARRRFWKACARAYGYLFEGIDLDGGEWLTPEAAEEIVRRAGEQRFLLATLGVVPAEFGRWQEDRQGNVLPMRKPAAPVKTVGRILELMGLRVEGRRVRRCSTSHGITYGKTTPSGTSEAKPAPRLVRVYRVTAESFATMSEAVERRNARRVVEHVPQVRPVAAVAARTVGRALSEGPRVGAALARQRVGALAADLSRRRGAA